jgi:hypothetical protein
MMLSNTSPRVHMLAHAFVVPAVVLADIAVFAFAGISIIESPTAVNRNLQNFQMKNSIALIRNFAIPFVFPWFPCYEFIFAHAKNRASWSHSFTFKLTSYPWTMEMKIAANPYVNPSCIVRLLGVLQKNNYLTRI